MSEPLQFWPFLIRALMDDGRLDDAAGHLADLVAGAQLRGLDLGTQIAALTGRLRAERGDPAAGLADLERAGELVTADTDCIERAEMLQDRGRLLLRLGRRPQATASFASARKLYDSMGAVRAIEHLDREVREGGLDERTRPNRTRFELTDRERDVAALVARGMTNREVAANLYVSTKAVEYHFGNIYAKLGINSRHRLTVVLGR